MKITSEKKAAAARANGARSHGPVTAEGKARSSRNNTIHGLSANTLVLRTEDSQAFLRLLSAYERRVQPRDELEQEIVYDIAIAAWFGQRILNYELRMLERNVDPLSLDRYLGRIEHARTRLMQELIDARERPLPPPGAPGRPEITAEQVEPITSCVCNESGPENEATAEIVPVPVSAAAPHQILQVEPITTCVCHESAPSSEATAGPAPTPPKPLLQPLNPLAHPFREQS
jgi:hypothetical protein